MNIQGSLLADPLEVRYLGAFGVLYLHPGELLSRQEEEEEVRRKEVRCISVDRVI